MVSIYEKRGYYTVAQSGCEIVEKSDNVIMCLLDKHPEVVSQSNREDTGNIHSFHACYAFAPASAPGIADFAFVSLGRNVMAPATINVLRCWIICSANSGG